MFEGESKGYVVMQISLDCNACCRKVKKVSHQYERPSNVAVKLQKKIERRVEIIKTEDLTGGHVQGEEGHDHDPPYEPQYEYPQQPNHMTTPLMC
ncbi:hypothetical protein N665_0614s0002 [Sinapis alba]|nr:hypothetical protein N665_0614s0002 [Sinapis alba]